MLSFLRIRNLAIAKDIALEWGEGLNLLTGETGAGKSMVVEALGLTLGDRASSDLLRNGEERAEIEAVFRLDPCGTSGPRAGDQDSVRSLLSSIGIELDGDEVVVRREIGDASRSRQFLCDKPVSLTTLRRFGELMVEIQGQHQHHALLASESQRDALDRFAGAGEERLKAAELARAANEAASAQAVLEASFSERESRLDYLRYQLRELEALGPSESEEASLRTERTSLAQACRRRELAEQVYGSVYEAEPSILAELARALAGLRKLGEIDPAAGPFAERAAQAEEILRDVMLDLRDYRERAEPDPGRLEEIESRLSEYERLSRKHGVAASGLAEKLRAMKAEAQDLEGTTGSLGAARAASLRLRSDYLEAASVLSSKRRAAAGRLAEALRRELATLDMGPCEVEIDVRFEEPPAGAPLKEPGLDRVELRLSPNPGEPPRALAEIASGGELSRAMLAVNGVLGAQRRRRTLVFDEVDAGIGGRTAAAVGEKLRALAANHQVIVITHLQQIASLADRHFLVTKRVERGRTEAYVQELDREARVTEIARMMGGAEITPLARRHAADMLRKPSGRSERRTS